MWGKFEQRLFITKLEVCEENIHRLYEFEADFVRNMRKKFDSIADFNELNLPTWKPTAKQLNLLEAIASAYR